jgi:hypothetical protein
MFGRMVKRMNILIHHPEIVERQCKHKPAKGPNSATEESQVTPDLVAILALLQA